MSIESEAMNTIIIVILFNIAKFVICMYTSIIKYTMRDTGRLVNNRLRRSAKIRFLVGNITVL